MIPANASGGKGVMAESAAATGTGDFGKVTVVGGEDDDGGSSLSCWIGAVGKVMDSGCWWT